MWAVEAEPVHGADEPPLAEQALGKELADSIVWLREADPAAWGGHWYTWEDDRGFVTVATTDKTTWEPRLRAAAAHPGRLRVVEVRWSERQLLDHYERVSRAAHDYLDVVVVGVDRCRNTVVVGVSARDSRAEARLRSAVGDPLDIEQRSGAFKPLASD
jgi:hypothetical protein